MFMKRMGILRKGVSVFVAAAFLFTTIGVEKALSLGIVPGVQTENFDSAYSLKYGIERAKKVMAIIEGAGSLSFSSIDEVAGSKVFLKKQIDDLDFEKREGEILITIADDVILRLYDPAKAGSNPRKGFAIKDHSLNKLINKELAVEVLCRTETKPVPEENTGEISAGLTTKELNVLREKIDKNRSKVAEKHPAALDAVRTSMKRLQERLDDINTQLEIYSVPGNRMGSIKYTLSQDPAKAFAWFETIVEDEEKYLLGFNGALAADLVLALISADPEGSLLDEYVLHEILENTGLTHYQIIGVTKHVFDRRWEGSKVGDSPLGRFLRKFINERAASQEETHKEKAHKESSNKTELPEYMEDILKALENREGVTYKAAKDLGLSPYAFEKKINLIRVNALKNNDKNTLLRLGRALVKYYFSTLQALEDSLGDISSAAKEQGVGYGTLMKRIERIKEWAEENEDMETLNRLKSIDKAKRSSKTDSPAWAKRLLAALEKTGGRKGEAAKIMGISYKSIVARVELIIKNKDIPEWKDHQEMVAELDELINGAMPYYSETVVKTLEDTRGDRKKTASILEIHTSMLYQKENRIRSAAILSKNTEMLARLEMIPAVSREPEAVLPAYTEETIKALVDSEGRRVEAANVLGIRHPSLTGRIKQIRAMAIKLEDEETLARLNKSLEKPDEGLAAKDSEKSLDRSSESKKTVNKVSGPKIKKPNYTEETLTALKKCKGKRALTAEMLGIKRTTLQERVNKIKTYAIQEGNNDILSRLYLKGVSGYAARTLDALENNDGNKVAAARELGIALASLGARLREIKEYASEQGDSTMFSRISVFYQTPDELPDYTDKTIKALEISGGRRDKAARLLGVNAIGYRITQIRDKATALNDKDTLERLEAAFKVTVLPEDTESFLNLLENTKGNILEAARFLGINDGNVRLKLDNILKAAWKLDRTDVIDRINNIKGDIAASDTPDTELAHPAQKSNLYKELPADELLSIDDIVEHMEYLVSKMTFEGKDKRLDFIRASGKYISINRDVIKEVFAEDSSPVVLRVPVEILESYGNSDTLDWLHMISTTGKVFIELFSMKCPDALIEEAALYDHYGIESHDNDNIIRTKHNTITLFATHKDVNKKEIQELFQTSESLKNSIVVPLGAKGDPTGIMRSALFGFSLMQLARDPENRSLAQDIVSRYDSVVSAYDLSGTGLTIDDINSMVTDFNLNSIVNVLMKIIECLPMERIDPEELKQIYERALRIEQAA